MYSKKLARLVFGPLAESAFKCPLTRSVSSRVKAVRSLCSWTVCASQTEASAVKRPLGRLGADVLGIDPVEDSVRTAELHSSYDPDLRERVGYQACTLEELTEEEVEGFHAVVASEVVEHLAHLEAFASCCQQMLKHGGSLFITTLNKTSLSYVFGIVAAEQLLRIVPSGTHDWEKFISPEDLEQLLESC